MKIISLKGITISSIFLILSCTTAIIDEGDKDSLPPITLTVTYEADVESIMTNNCITCHSGSSPSASLDLSNYQNTKFSAAQGDLVSRMNNTSNPMPPTGKLSPEILQIIDKWITDGYPEE